MMLDLHSADLMWSALDRKVRNQIRKASKSGLTHHHGCVELIDEFYRVFATNMRDLGTPVYGRRLFEEILSAFPERAHLHVVRLGTETVAAGLTFCTGDRIEVPSASSLREHNALCPNHLLCWNIIERAAGNGCTVLDFGRSTPGHGTFKFKEQWGAAPVPLYWEYQLIDRAEMPNTSPSNPKFHAAIELWKRCPLWIANRVGPVIARSLP
jgi:FemAB-related protein (PEP-CTERM system-associated)